MLNLLESCPGRRCPWGDALGWAWAGADQTPHLEAKCSAPGAERSFPTLQHLLAAQLAGGTQLLLRNKSPSSGKGTGRQLGAGGGRLPLHRAAGAKCPAKQLLCGALRSGIRGPLLSPGPFGGSSRGGMERGDLLSDGGPRGSGDSVLGAIGGLHTPTLLLGASEVPAASLMVSSARGSAKCAFWPEMGKGKKKSWLFLFLF